MRVIIYYGSHNKIASSVIPRTIKKKKKKNVSRPFYQFLPSILILSITISIGGPLLHIYNLLLILSKSLRKIIMVTL